MSEERADLQLTVDCSTRAHPASAQQWYLTDEGVSQLRDDLPGKPVQMNYSGQPVGHVVTVGERNGDMLQITIDVVDPQVAKLLEPRTFGPALFNADAAATMRNAGEYPLGPEWRLKAVGAVQDAPKSEPEIVGEASASGTSS